MAGRVRNDGRWVQGGASRRLSPFSLLSHGLLYRLADKYGQITGMKWQKESPMGREGYGKEEKKREEGGHSFL